MKKIGFPTFQKNCVHCNVHSPANSGYNTKLCRNSDYGDSRAKEIRGTVFYNYWCREKDCPVWEKLKDGG